VGLLHHLAPSAVPSSFLELFGRSGQGSEYLTRRHQTPTPFNRIPSRARFWVFGPAPHPSPPAFRGKGGFEQAGGDGGRPNRGPSTASAAP